jgi:hypothetical protein
VETAEDRILDGGDHVFVVTRRLFPGDVQRHFVGTVDRATQNAILVHGYAFVREVAHGEFVRRKRQRSRVFPLDNHIVIFVLPDDVEIEQVRYERRQGQELVVTDGRQFRIDISEFGI